MAAFPLEARQPKGRSLALLAEDVRLAHDLVHELRGGRQEPIVHDRLLAARRALLIAMESYAAELTARGLPLPRKLHGDLRLQRDLGQHPETSR
jgi:hypothetical protein